MAPVLTNYFEPELFEIYPLLTHLWLANKWFLVYAEMREFCAGQGKENTENILLRHLTAIVS